MSSLKFYQHTLILIFLTIFAAVLCAAGFLTRASASSRPAQVVIEYSSP